MKNQAILIGFSLLMALPSTGITAEPFDRPGTGDQRAACDARCREDHQNNAAAMEACLRDCGAVGPASPAGAAAIGHEATHTVQQGGADPAPAASARATTVKSSKSNSSERGTTVKSGKSNSSDRATTVKGSKSNSDDRQASPETGEASPAEPTDG